MNRSINEAVGSGILPRLNRASGQPDLISMQAKELLNLRRLPAMLNAPQTAVILGVGEHDMPALIRAGLLEPLGEPQVNAVKYFAAIHILEMAGDPAFLGKIRNALYEYWQGKNGSKSSSRKSRKGGFRHE
jgi:hypothetical protein